MVPFLFMFVYYRHWRLKQLFTMDQDHQVLWNKIKDFELDDPGSAFPFSARLARENQWRLKFALRAIDEYKKFIFLSCISSHPLAPSDQIDQVWHLHLLYTQSYWIEMCENMLSRQIHHSPTTGGEKEKIKFSNWYEETRKFYRNVFKLDPPIDIWPDGHARFSDVLFARINLKRNWIIKKPNFF
jgi:hypothetical protein